MCNFYREGYDLSLPGFDINKFKEGKLGVLCETEEIAKNFLKECNNEDLKWSTGHKASDLTNWNISYIHEVYTYNKEKNSLEYHNYEDTPMSLEILRWGEYKGLI